MDFTLSLSSDLFNLLSIPLIVLTIRDLKPKWKSIWDNQLSPEDRRLLLRMVIFLVLPVVVLIHELGHLAAALCVGAQVRDFHYGPVAGHVTVAGGLAPVKTLWISLAGNLAQVGVGLVSLAAAAAVRSPPATAFLVYLGLFSIGDTAIFYAALSLASIYGDWIQIYQSPCPDIVSAVFVVHAVLVLFVVYCVTGTAPRLWFTKKTMPDWSESHRRLAQEAKLDPRPATLTALASSFMEAGFFKEAERCLAQADLVDPGNPCTEYAKAELQLAANKTEKAEQIFKKLAAGDRISPEMRAGVICHMGELHLYRRDHAGALKCFEMAADLDETLGDARLQKALLRTAMNNFESLEEDLQVLKCRTRHWMFKRNQEAAPKVLQELESLAAARRDKKQ